MDAYKYKRLEHGFTQIEKEINTDFFFRNGKSDSADGSPLAVVLSVNIAFQIRENPWQSRFKFVK